MYSHSLQPQINIHSLIIVLINWVQSLEILVFIGSAIPATSMHIHNSRTFDGILLFRAEY